MLYNRKKYVSAKPKIFIYIKCKEKEEDEYMEGKTASRNFTSLVFSYEIKQGQVFQPSH